MARHGIGEQPPQFVDSLVASGGRTLSTAAGAKARAADHQRIAGNDLDAVARHEALYTLNDRARGGHRPVAEVRSEAVRVEALGDQAAGEQGPNFRGEKHRVPLGVDVERLDAQAVAGEDELALRLVPDRQGEHAAQPRKNVDPPTQVTLEDNFRVRARLEGDTLVHQLVADVHEVVDFAVVRDGRFAMTIGHGLGAETGEVEDG